MPIPRALGLVCSLLFVACAKDGEQAGGTPPSAKQPPAADAPPSGEDDDSTAPAAADRCAEIAAEFRDTLEAATGACTTAADCGCYNPVAAEAGCGGVTDRATTDALADLERSFHAASCPWPHQCPAWACTPACVDGRCQSEAPAAP